MSRTIRKVAVLGSGVMGSGIAAQFANCGIPVLLLDIVPKLSDEDRAKGIDEKSPQFRNRLAAGAIERSKKGRPTPAFYHVDAANLITAGNLEDDFEALADVDWIVEVVLERMDIKQDIFRRVAAIRRPDTIVSSNTSGLSLEAMTEGLDESFRKHFLVTHFFNPVRHMRLLELVPLPDTDPAIVRQVADIGSRVLGKGIVYCKDTPNFIGNRIGVYAFLDSFRHVSEGGFTVPEVDAVFGPALARPKTAAFKTADLVGVDTMLLVARSMLDACKEDPALEGLSIPDFLPAMVEAGLLGNKSKAGFYKKEKGEGGKPRRMVLDLEEMKYIELERPKFDSLKMSKGIEDVRERFKAVVGHEDRAGQLAWAAMSGMMVYSADLLLEIADDVVNVDRAMRWGYNWELGPFESWDAVGVRAVAERLEAEGRAVPEVVAAMLDAGAESFYKVEGAQTFFWDPKTMDYQALLPGEGELALAAVRNAEGAVVSRNPGATLLDLGEGILGLEFHTKMNSIDDDILGQLTKGLDLLDESSDWRGLVLANEGAAFCAGANVMVIVMAAMGQDWDTIELATRTLQDLTLRMKRSQKPVVAAPFGMTLGGGCEIMMGAQAVQAHAELYSGLVELGVGLIPAGGGCKELLFRHMASIPEGVNAEPFDMVQHVFGLIGQAQVSMSAAEARARGFLSAHDGVTTNRARLTSDACRKAIAMSETGWRPATPRTIAATGRTGFATLQVGIRGFRTAGHISDHDVTIATHLARILTGGDVAAGEQVDEQQILDLEREAFLSLCGEAKTQERIQHFLTTGKPLRN